MEYTNLFSPGTIGSMELKNRIVMEPMLVGVGEKDGTVGERMLRYYEERAKGGVGLIMTEVTRVNEKNGATSPLQMALSSDRHIESFKRLADTVHQYGTKIVCELHHPGRQNFALLATTWKMSQRMGKIWKGYWDVFFKIGAKRADVEKSFMRHFFKSVVGPSAVPCGLGYRCEVKGQPTRALKISEIHEIVGQFSDAAVRAQKAGLDGVCVHASHGYLIQQFLSPYTNRRTDEYGGSLENRMRFLTEIIRDIQKKCGPDYPIIVRLTVDEYYDLIGYPELGYHMDEGVKMAQALEKLGIAAIDVSSGGYEQMNAMMEPTSFEPGWRKHLAKAVKEVVRIPVIAANVIRTPEQAESQLADGTQDFIGLGRPVLVDPYWAQKAQEGRSQEIDHCISCLWCVESMQENAWINKSGECALNPRTFFETKYDLDPPKDGAGRTVVVAGAGPAGLTAARELAKRGFDTVVLEKEDQAGGQLNLADKPPHKEKIGWAVADLERDARASGAKIRYNTPATAETIKELSPYAVVLATGGEAVFPRIPGADQAHVSTVTPVLEGKIRLSGKKVAVIGSGMTGLETAELIAAQGNEVFIVEMADELAPGAWGQNFEDIMHRLNALKVEFITGHKLAEIREESVVLEAAATGQKIEKTAEQVVLSVGVKSYNPLEKELKGSIERVYAVGDAQKIGRIANATHTAYHVARDLV